MTPMRDDMMVQEQIKGPWQHMVGVICLNLTNRKQVKRVLPRFFKKWPTPHKLLKSTIPEIEREISELGMQKTRALKLYRMSEQYLNWDGRDAKELYGIGEYGSDSYEIFFKNNHTIQPKDKELKKYLENLK